VLWKFWKKMETAVKHKRFQVIGWMQGMIKTKTSFYEEKVEKIA